MTEPRENFDFSISAYYDLCLETYQRILAEEAKEPKRYDIINLLLGRTRERRYLEIGVRNPADCFDRIHATVKISVDPGVEIKTNLADIQLTSDEFFGRLATKRLQLPCEQFDVIFIDGLHLANQVYVDIANALKYVASPGYIVLHDCNPPTHFHAREIFLEPGAAGGSWNGTTWKALQRFRTEHDQRCFVVDTDWGVGIIETHRQAEARLPRDLNPFYEYEIFSKNRQQILDLTPCDRLEDKLGV